MACNADGDCHGRGVCLSSVCECDLYTDGDHCETPFKDELDGINFDAWQYTFLALFIILTLVTSYHLYVFVRRHSFFQIKGMTHFFLWAASFLRFLYFATDPMGQTRVIPFALEQFLFGFAFYFIFLSYLTLVLFWAGSYHNSLALGGGKGVKISWLLTNTRPIFIVVAILWFILEFTDRLIFGAHLKTEGHGDVLFDELYNIYIAVVAFIISITMAIYGSLLMRRLQASDAAFARVSNLKQIRKLTVITVVVSVTLFIAVLAVIIIVVLNGLYTPRGAIASFSVDHALELILISEMAYFMQPEREQKSTSSGTSTTTASKEGGGGSGGTHASAGSKRGLVSVDSSRGLSSVDSSRDMSDSDGFKRIELNGRIVVQDREAV